MKLNPRKILFGDPKSDRPVLLAVTPPSTGERTLLGVENMLQAIAVPEPFSLELAGDVDGVTLMARCLDEQVVRQQISTHYPQARIHEVTPEDDPLRLDEDERAWSMTLRASGPEYVPLRTFRDDDLLDPGSDPLIALLGALSDLNEGERVVARLMLRSLGPDWSQAHLEKAHKRPVQEPRDSTYSNQVRHHQSDVTTMAVLGVAALVGLRGYLWVRAGETWKAALLGVGMAAVLTVAGWAWWRIRKARSRVYDPLLIREKVARIAFDAELQVTAVLPPGGTAERARGLLGPVAAAYRHYDHPAGAGFRVSRVRSAAVPNVSLHPAGPGLFGGRSVLGVREAAAMWHPPGAHDETPLVARSGAKALIPSARGVKAGAPVGDTTAGKPREIRFPEDLLRRHHLYVARTRMGKSTLMHHLIVHKMREKAAGRDGDAIVVVDPHADLVGALLEQVPEEIADRVRLIDLADQRGAPGVNLLDTRVFSDRDRTADSVVRVARGLWDQWGPRMQSILEQTVKTLHEANEHPDTDAHEQLTLLDGLKLLSDDEYRGGVLARVSDPYLLEWWARDFGNWRRKSTSPRPSPRSRHASPTTRRPSGRGPCHRPVPLHHRHARDHPRRRHPAGLDRTGSRRQGRGRAGGRVPAQPGRLGHTRAGRPAAGEEARRAGGRRRDAVDARRGLRVDAQRARQVRGVLHPGDPEPRQAGRSLANHARHPARQRGMPGRLPGVRVGRPPARVGARQGQGVRGRHRVAAGAPLLRPRHCRNGAYARLLDDGQKAGARRPGQGRTHQGRLVLLRHDGGGDGDPAGRGQKARGRLPQGLPRHEERREPSAGRVEGWCPPGPGGEAGAAKQAHPAADRSRRARDIRRGA